MYISRYYTISHESPHPNAFGQLAVDSNAFVWAVPHVGLAAGQCATNDSFSGNAYH